MSNKMKLYCLPYAGGSAMVYRNWMRDLNSFIDLNPIEYAGRGKRTNSPLYNNLDEAIDDIYNIIKDDINGENYAIFGHSMGGILACELAFRLKEAGFPEPTHLFISGMYPLHVKCETRFHQLPYEEFKKEMSSKFNFPEEIFTNKRLADIFIPMLYSDFKIFENYVYESKGTKLNCNLTILMSSEDRETKVDEIDIDSWNKYTNKKCECYEFEGGHFFINEKVEEVISLVNNTLSQYLSEECCDESINFG